MQNYPVRGEAMLRQIECGVINGPVTKDGVLPVTI